MNHHPIILPVSAAQKDPLFSNVNFSTRSRTFDALSSGVMVLARSFSLGTPLAVRRERSMSVLTCHIQIQKLVDRSLRHYIPKTIFGHAYLVPNIATLPMNVNCAKAKE